MFDKIDEKLLKAVADLHEIPAGAYNIRKNGQMISRNTTANINIESTPEGGLNIFIKDNTQNESVHIPVILSQSGINESVENNFYIGKNCSVTIVAGCGIHTTTDKASSHNGKHSFVVGENSKVKYLEKHYGFGKKATREMNPETFIELKENASLEMETVQIGGVSKSIRNTNSVLAKNSTLKITEKIMTEFDEFASTNFVADLNGENSSCHIISRAVAKDNSIQEYKSVVNGRSKCFGHTECDCIVMDNAKVSAVPEVNALSTEASLIHEAAIGKIAGEQIVKLMTLGLSEEEAQKLIINGFLN